MIAAILMLSDMESVLIAELQRLLLSDDDDDTMVQAVSRVLDDLATLPGASEYGPPLFSALALNRFREVLHATPTDVSAIKYSLRVMLLLAGIDVEIDLVSTPTTSPVQKRRCEPQEAAHRDAKRTL
jgi:hypothetical protein